MYLQLAELMYGKQLIGGLPAICSHQLLQTFATQPEKSINMFHFRINVWYVSNKKLKLTSIKQMYVVYVAMGDFSLLNNERLERCFRWAPWNPLAYFRNF